MTEPDTSPTDDRAQRLRRLFDEATRRSPDRRDAFIHEACADDPELAGELIELLAGHAESITDPDGVEIVLPPAELERGDRIGPYLIEQRLGSGGFGEVYLARQVEPVQRQVALKLIRPGMDSRTVVARFEVERQALALMNDPGIAQVFDAGATPEGRPYFVMEYVRGEPITRYCDHHRLDTVQRLELFVEVCNAIQHAHQKGVIHRDIKPGNVLVTTDDLGHPQPKVIDFGIAKSMTEPLTGEPLHTREGILVGTPEYMPPEQAELDPGRIDTRSDVYALGALLYEVLCGAVPFDRDRLEASTPAELQRIIREDPPPRPGTRLGTLDPREAERIADARGTRPAELRSTLARELEWIPLKALRKDRDQRYATPLAVAADIRRYLASEPLEAGPESAGYRLRTLVRRNRGPFIAAALVTLALVLGLIGTSYFALRAQRLAESALADQRTAEAQRDLAEARRVEAEAQSERAEGVRGFFTRLFYNERALLESDRPRGDTAFLLSLLDEGSGRLDSELEDYPTDQSTVRLAMAALYATAGERDRSRTLLERTLDEIDRTTDPRLRRGLLLRTGYGYQLIDCHAEALAIYSELLPEQRIAHGDLDEQTIRILNFMGYAEHALGRHAEAMSHYEVAVQASTRLHGIEHPMTRLLRNRLDSARKAEHPGR